MFLKIGKMYRTIEVPGGLVFAWLKDPYTFLPLEGPDFKATTGALLSPIPSKTLVMVVEHGMASEETDSVDYLYWKVILGEEFYWVHPYDLVEVDENGTPIIPDYT